jgi:hypothetical protein
MMPRRVLLAPVETAGVASATRDALRRRGHTATLETFDRHPFGWQVDRIVGRAAPGRIRAGLRAPLRHDVLHFQFGTTFCAFADAAWARAVGRPLLLMHYWGSDCRTRDIAERLFPARARLYDVGVTDGDRAVRARLRAAGRLCAAALVSDLELAAYVAPYFRTVYVLPTPVALPTANATVEPLTGEGPIVLHAPSKAAIKGTSEIVAALEAAGRVRPIQPRLVSGVARDEVIAEIDRADIVIDQLNSETSGVFALEAMALGKPVLSEYQRKWLAPFARSTPIVPVTADTLVQRLVELCDDAEARQRIGSAGKAFVESVHQADLVAELLEKVYVDANDAQPGIFEVTPEGMRTLRSPAR